MQINTSVTSTVQVQQTKEVQQTQSTNKTEELFKSLRLNDLGETDLKKLTYEEAKAIQQYREKEGLESPKGEANFGGHRVAGDSLLQITTFTDDDAFNKAAFNKMKEKEFPSMYLNEIEHNMNHMQGKREHPFPTLLHDELYGGFSGLTETEIKSIDIELFMEQMISIYTRLLSTGSHVSKDKTEQSLNDMKDIQNDYYKYKEENEALLKEMTKTNSMNPVDKTI